MLYPVLLYVFAGFFGTLLALRLMAIEASERETILTRRGRIVIGIVCGLVVGAFIVFINGLWWECDVSACGFNWRY